MDFLEECKRAWLESQMELWWAARESCIYDPKVAQPYSVYFETENLRWEREIRPEIETAYEVWSNALFEQPAN